MKDKKMSVKPSQIIKQSKNSFVDLTNSGKKSLFIKSSSRVNISSTPNKRNFSINSLEIGDIQKNFSEKNNSNASSVKVVARFRPLNLVEQELIDNNIGTLTPSFNDNCVIVDEKKFSFDKVYDMNTTNKEIYDFIGKETIEDVCSGYNGTIFAYGQSGSGKTHTMYGDELSSEEKGIVPRAIDNLFEIIENSVESINYQIKFSMLQIYKEVIYDLLTGDRDLKIKESPLKGIYVDNLSEFFIDNKEFFFELIQRGQDNRNIGETKLNKNSSRSHTIFILEVQHTCNSNGVSITKKGTLNLVDLAGSEKVSKTGAVGGTLEEAKKINLSLSALGNVIFAITNESNHIPYRDSKLTRILQESLGGNFKTSLIATCSPHTYNVEESISTLQFAQRVKKIKNNVKVNIKLSYEELQKMVTNLKSELDIAKNELVKVKSSNNQIIDITKCSESEELDELKNSVKRLENELKRKETLIIESNKDILNDCSTIYKKILENKIQPNTYDIEDFIRRINNLLKSFDEDLKIQSFGYQIENIITQNDMKHTEIDKNLIFENLIKMDKDQLIARYLQFYLNLQLLENMNHSLIKQNKNLILKFNTMTELINELVTINNNLINKPIRRNSVILSNEGRMTKQINSKNVNILKSMRRSSIDLAYNQLDDGENFPSYEKIIELYNKQIESMKDFVVESYKENKKIKNTFEDILNDYKDIIIRRSEIYLRFKSI